MTPNDMHYYILYLAVPTNKKSPEPLKMCEKLNFRKGMSERGN